ncbi:MAG TPA: ABC transporter ATP-binding protein [Vicinamibacterales bacterium]|nr:ABC transporter ATP-binding protein [Vicinamibacterales bacterium]
MIEDFDRLTVTSLSRHYGRRKALSKVTFSCSSGDIAGLLGPNGAGKSTLLAILGTLLAPSEGGVRYGDVTAEAGGAGLRARIGMLGHDLFLYPELTAHENLTFFGRLYGVPDAASRAGAALARAGLGERAHDAVSGFSRGMRQRVALERALLHQPRLLLLDEPFTGLDQASTAALVARLKEEQGRGVLTVLATHDLDVVDGLLTRELFLRNGRLMEVGVGEGSLRERYRAAIATA